MIRLLYIGITMVLLLYCSTRAMATEKLTVEITGIGNALLKNVEAFLSIRAAEKAQKTDLLNGLQSKGPDRKTVLSEWDIRRLHRAAPEEIRLALQPFGYYKAEIKTQLEEIEGEWLASYTIQAGQETLLDIVEIEIIGTGREEQEVQKLVASTTLIPGKRLNHQLYEELKSKLSDALYNAGFIDAEFTRNKIVVYPEKDTANIYLTVKSGPRFKFGPVTVKQNILYPEVVEKFSPFKQGERFAPDKLIDFQLALMDSNYFKRVEILAEREKAVGTEIPIVVKTVANKPRRYTVGFGFGTDTGPRITAGAELRRLNRRGHKMRFDLLASGIEQAASIQYQIPVKNITTDKLSFTLSGSQAQEGDLDTDQFTLAASLNENWRGFRRRLYLSLARENFEVATDTQTSTLLTPGVELSRKYLDDQLFPRKGYSIAFDLHGGLESPLTETTFLHTSMKGRVVMPIGKQGRLLLRGEYGLVQTSSFSQLPPSERFFAGGDQSVRGYGYQDLSPRDSEGNIIGGAYLATASIEADYLIYNNFGVATFFDAGNSGTDALPELKTSLGVGLRYKSPVGMIRLDLAHPFDSSEESYRFHISIGVDL